MLWRFAGGLDVVSKVMLAKISQLKEDTVRKIQTRRREGRVRDFDVGHDWLCCFRQSLIWVRWFKNWFCYFRGIL